VGFSGPVMTANVRAVLAGGHRFSSAPREAKNGILRTVTPRFRGLVQGMADRFALPVVFKKT
jgi:hypothetical protein